MVTAAIAVPLQLLGCLPLAAILLAALRYAKKRMGVSAKRARCAGQVAIVTGGSSGVSARARSPLRCFAIPRSPLRESACVSRSGWPSRTGWRARA